MILTLNKLYKDSENSSVLGPIMKGNLISVGFTIGMGQLKWTKGDISVIDPIDVPKQRRQEPEAELTEIEIYGPRALCGSMQFAAVHTRPDQ